MYLAGHSMGQGMQRKGREKEIDQLANAAAVQRGSFYLGLSASMSGIVPVTGGSPPPSSATNSASACAKNAKFEASAGGGGDARHRSRIAKSSSDGSSGAGCQSERERDACVQGARSLRVNQHRSEVRKQQANAAAATAAVGASNGIVTPQAQGQHYRRRRGSTIP
jgi:hypothetical protein